MVGKSTVVFVVVGGLVVRLPSSGSALCLILFGYRLPMKTLSKTMDPVSTGSGAGATVLDDKSGNNLPPEYNKYTSRD